MKKVEALRKRLDDCINDNDYFIHTSIKDNPHDLGNYYTVDLWYVVPGYVLEEEDEEIADVLEEEYNELMNDNLKALYKKLNICQ
jgi:hypothetical protein